MSTATPGRVLLTEAQVAKRMTRLLRQNTLFRELLSEVYEVDGQDECRYDHHDLCQAHGIGGRPCIMERIGKALGRKPAEYWRRQALRVQRATELGLPSDEAARREFVRQFNADVPLGGGQQ